MMTLLLTLIPSILILMFFVLSDKFKEPPSTIILVFFLGFLICLPAGILNEISHNFFFTGSDFSNNLTSSLFPTFVTEVGLYDNNKNLMGYARLSKPIPKSTSIPMRFFVRMDY